MELTIEELEAKKEEIAFAMIEAEGNEYVELQTELDEVEQLLHFKMEVQRDEVQSV